MTRKIIAAFVALTLLGASAFSFAAPLHPGPQRAIVHEARVDRIGRDWPTGERVSAAFRHHNFVVDNWRGHSLDAPPRGCQWVGVNGDYVLAAIGTGIIASVIAR
ncbi:Nickel/cobalt transporter regulator [Paraburkholderia caballeronis]|uniref:Nickel/cobalt transporter regulator n=2 Tax=Paraburkholderia caballeronis TaxID=416943 RepID=A0A1H7EW57_9BURK|nr:nickel/cobalt transporter regulator [Paraburkholderia caballeronis]PXW93341.1 nickel/cobalt transporter regulator [Paraburkholderia caballeronis]RAJ87245.1 nickel/cobalt transporter regulator [Paraburkholderia caballeronis]SEE81330.1 Nickel/cobalt transporter regulator [Paraburkholderia caballeronis]SEK18089.1 Nickel/cobalt transporter regulator [Paraburkholderia caballeronis]